MVLAHADGHLPRLHHAFACCDPASSRVYSPVDRGSLHLGQVHVFEIAPCQVFGFNPSALEIKKSCQYREVVSRLDRFLVESPLTKRLVQVLLRSTKVPRLKGAVGEISVCPKFLG